MSSVPLPSRSVPNPDQVVGQLLDDLRGLAGYGRVAVLGDEDGLGRLNEDDAVGLLLAVDRARVGLQAKELAARRADPIRLRVGGRTSAWALARAWSQRGPRGGGWNRRGAYLSGGGVVVDGDQSSLLLGRELNSR